MTAHCRPPPSAGAAVEAAKAANRFRSDPMTRWILYQRDDCHLCDLALAELAAARAPEIASVFIDGDPDLEPRYGIRVPVLRDALEGRELDWPFDRTTLSTWLFEDDCETERFS